MPKGFFERPSMEELFWRKVNATENPEECWLWIAAKFNNSGYGQFCNQKSKEKLAHRISWTLHFGEIPEGLLVCHKCDVKLCVNPKHLFLGTYKDNTDDRDAKGRGKFPGANNPARGDRNGSRTHPERLCRGTIIGLGNILKNIKERRMETPDSQ